MLIVAFGSQSSSEVTPAIDRIQFLVAVGLKFLLPQWLWGLEELSPAGGCSHVEDNKLAWDTRHWRKTSKWMIKMTES